MPTTTGTQNLTIPTSTDNIEDQWLYHSQMAAQMEQRFNSHDADALRVNPRPLAIIDCTVSRDYPLNTLSQFDRTVLFDTVMVDTAGMVDLVSQPYAITPQETGEYHYSAYVKILPSGCAGPGAVSMFIAAQGTGTLDGNLSGSFSVEVGVTGSTSVNASGDVRVTALGSSIGFCQFSFLGSSCAQTFTTVYGRLCVYKVRDL